jgi:hypothetical protein
MPKKRIASEPTEDYPDLSGWQATGPSLAVASSGAFGGLGTLVGAIILAPVIHALVRLRSVAPDAATIAELVAATLGGRAGTFTATLQTIGYAVLAVVGAQTFGLQMAAPVIDEPATVAETWTWPVYSVAALVLITLLAYALPGRVVAGLAAVLAAVGLLITFYNALAIIASVLSGTPPVDVGGEPLPTGFATASALAVLAVGLVGFDVITTRAGEVRWLGRPMGIAIGAVTLVALLVWLADHLGGTGALRLSPRQFGYIVYSMYPEAGVISMAVATVCLGFAAVLGLMWAIVRLVQGVDDRISSEAALAILLGLMAVLIVARCRDWVGIHGATNYVGELVLLLVYAVVVEASARIPGGQERSDSGTAAGESTVIWWSRILVPSALAAVALLPVVNSRFAVSAVWPLAIVAVIAAIAAAVSVMGRREAAD